MANLTQWTLPLNPPNLYPFYLQYISEEQRSKLYYTKYILDVIGELDVAATVDNVREWVLPPQIYAPHAKGNPIGITYGPSGQVWFALEDAHRLAVLDPATGTFTSYGGSFHPIPYPRHLMFERGGALWYTGSGGTSPVLIGRLNRGRTSATYWELPSAFIEPFGLWVQPNGKVVWFSPINSNIGVPGAFLGRLEVGTNQLTYWSYPPPGARPICAGTRGFPLHQPADIWFTQDDGGPSSRVFRFELSSGNFYEYAPPTGMASPRRIAFDSTGSAWVSDRQGKITNIAATANCGTANFVATTVTLNPIQRKVNKKQASATPAVHTAAPTQHAVSPVKSACQTDFPMPYPLTAGEIQVSSVPGGQTSVYVTASGIDIARLQP